MAAGPAFFNIGIFDVLLSRIKGGGYVGDSMGV